MSELFQTVEPYLQNVKLLTLASCKNNAPWCATVFYAFDSKLNFYFLSKPFRRHSQEILGNPNVSFTVVEQRFEFGDKNMQGVQAEGKCDLLTGKVALAAFEVYKRRFPLAEKVPVTDLTGESKSDQAHRIWKISPAMIKIIHEEKYGVTGKEFKL